MIADILFRLFKKQFNQLAFNDWHKPNRNEGLKFGFVCEGVNYYVYNNVFDLPLARMGKIQVLLTQLASCITDAELQKFLANMDENLNKAMEGNAVKNFSKIGWLIKEMQTRKEMLVHPELLTRIAAACSIAEGQDPTEWNDEVEYQKFKTFERHLSGEAGLFPFFQSAGLTQFSPGLSNIESDFNQYWEESKSRIAATEQIMQSMKSN